MLLAGGIPIGISCGNGFAGPFRGFGLAFAQELGEGSEAAVPLLENAIILGEEMPGGIPRSSSIFAIIRMILALGLAAAAVYGVVFLFRRAARPQDARNSHLKILATTHLGSNRYLYVVSVGGKAWLVGAGEGGVSLIAELDDQEAIDSMLLDESQRGAEASRLVDFRALLQRFRGGGNSLAGENAGFSAEAMRKNRERIKRL